MKLSTIKFLIIIMASSALLFAGCQKKAQEDELIIQDDLFEVDMHNSSNSLDIIGTYEGVLPCADCEGIKTTISLGQDNTYTISTTYLGKSGDNSFESSGTFTWSESGDIITLTGESAPNRYFIGENKLFHLDLEGNRISGDLAEKYILNKQ